MNLLERSTRRLDAFQQRHLVTAFAVGVVKKYGDDRGGTLAAQLTYAMFVSVFPLLLLLVTILGVVLAGHPAERARVLHSALGQFPLVGQQLGHSIHTLKRRSTFGLVVGIVGLTYGAMRLAQSGLYSMEQVWNIPVVQRPNYFTRLARAGVFLLELAVGLVVTTALAGFGTFGRHDPWLGALGEVLAAAINVMMYWAAFRTLTPRPVTSRSLIPGVIVGGVAWTILQAAGGYVVGHYLRGASALYGLFGLVLGLLAWIYLGAQVTLYAAEISSVLHHRLWPRGLVQPPLTDADQRSLVLHAAQSQRRPEEEIVVSFRTESMSQDEHRERGYRVDESTSERERPSPANLDE